VINEIMDKEEGIGMAGKMLLTVTREEVERAQQETALKIRMDWTSYMSEARNEGLAKGRAKAEAKARREKFESARKLKKIGLTAAQIQDTLGLSPEDIEKL
jgi:predicted transposase YdaD